MKEDYQIVVGWPAGILIGDVMVFGLGFDKKTQVPMLLLKERAIYLPPPKSNVGDK